MYIPIYSNRCFIPLSIFATEKLMHFEINQIFDTSNWLRKKCFITAIKFPESGEYSKCSRYFQMYGVLKFVFTKRLYHQYSYVYY